jgi:hypothetical protein
MDRSQPSQRRRIGLRFCLRALLLVVLLVAVYLGGRASVNWPAALAPKLAGSWTATMPRGHKQPTTIRSLGQGQFLVSSRAAVFNGTYQWHNGRLVVITPADVRMSGLVWKWDGKQLILVGEPANTPTGASYVGTVLDRQPSE